MPLDVTQLHAKIETTYGVDSAPTAAADAFIVFGHEVTPFEAEDVRRSIDRGFAGSRPRQLTRIRQRHRFSVELCGSGTAATPAKWGTLLRGCLFAAPTIATDVTYNLDSAGDGSSLTIHAWKGSGSEAVRHRAPGSRGNARFVYEEGSLPRIEFEFTGLLLNDPDANAPTAPTLPSYPVPLEVNTANTSFSLGGFAALLRSFTLDLGNKVAYRSLVGQRAVIFDKADDGDRRAAGGELVIELPDPTARAYFADARNRTDLALSLIHGTAAGNIVTLTSSRLQLGAPSYSVEQNRRMMNASFDLVPSAAGNELVLKTG